MVSRLLAVLVAAALVAGAFVARDRLDGTSSAGDTAQAATLVCIPELAAVCEDLVAAVSEQGRELAVHVTPAWSTIDELQEGEGRPGHLWLTFDPFPQVLADRRERAGVSALPIQPEPLARSPLVLAVWEDRRAVLDEHCGGEADWRCIGEVAGQPWSAIGGDDSWGLVKPGYADPSQQAEGTLVLAQAATSRLGGPPTRADLEEPMFFSWFAGLQEAVPAVGPTADPPLVAMVQFGRARFDVVGTTEAAAVELLHRAGSRAEGLTLQPSPPTLTAQVVLTPLGEAAAASGVADLGRDALGAHGWRVDEAAPEGGLEEVTVPAGADLPDAGTVEAVRSEVRA